MATPDQRAHLAGVMQGWIARHERLLWQEIRPMRQIHWYETDLWAWLDAGHTITMDCSETVTVTCKLAGLKDPNGNSYNGKGYTGTMLAHLPHLKTAKDLDVGGLVVFGPGTGDHVAQVLEPGADPLLCSHGADRLAGPIRLSVEQTFHKPPVTFLSIAHL